LSRESGFDAKNAETFGTCAVAQGWSFEAALAANERLYALAANPALAQLDSVADHEELEEEVVYPQREHMEEGDDEGQVARSLINQAYAVATARSTAPDFRRCVLSGKHALAERCPSTAATSGAASPSGSASAASGDADAASGPPSAQGSSPRVQEEAESQCTAVASPKAAASQQPHLGCTREVRFQ